MGEETTEMWKGQDLALSLYVSSTMTGSVEPRYSYCRFPEDCSPPGDRYSDLLKLWDTTTV
jgi:hypothetical protein